jgi:hypothetical protein
VGKNGHEPDESFRKNCEGLAGGMWMSVQDGDALELFLKEQVVQFLIPQGAKERWEVAV